MSNETDKNVGLPQFEKNRYFYGKLMTVRDFDQEQAYFNGKRQLINRLLFGAGTVCGLIVDWPIEGNKSVIRISAGVALDHQGREIVVPEDLIINATDDPLKSLTDNEYYLVLNYDECYKEPVRAHDSSACKEICQYGRIIERYRITAVSTDPAPSSTRDLSCDMVSKNRTHTDVIFSSDSRTVYGTCTRTIRKHVQAGTQPGTLYEVVLRIDAAPDQLAHALSITDTPDSNTDLVYGTFRLDKPVNQSTTTTTYIIRVNGPVTISSKAEVNGTSAGISQPDEQTIDPTEVSELKYLDDIMISRRAAGYLSPDPSAGIVLAKIRMASNIVENIWNLHKTIIYDSPSIAHILSCLRDQLFALENQALKIKEQIAPNRVDIVAPSSMKAGSKDGVIIIRVMDNESQPLPDIKVEVFATLGSLNTNQVTTGTTGTATVRLDAASTPGIMTILAYTHSGIGVANISCIAETPKTGSIHIVSVPPGAAISIDGTPTGKITPNKIDDLPAGSHMVRLVRTGYTEYTQSIPVTAGETYNLAVNLVQQTGFLKIQSTPVVGAYIYIDNNLQSQQTAAGGTTLTIATGIHTVAVKKDGYVVPPSQSVEVKTGETKSLEFTLAALTGTVILILKDTKTGGIVSNATLTLLREVNGIFVEYGVSPSFSGGKYSYQNLLYGSYQVSIAASGYQPALVLVKLNNPSVSVEVGLTPVISIHPCPTQLVLPSCPTQLVQPSCPSHLVLPSCPTQAVVACPTHAVIKPTCPTQAILGSCPTQAVIETCPTQAVIKPACPTQAVIACPTQAVIGTCASHLITKIPGLGEVGNPIDVSIGVSKVGTPTLGTAIGTPITGITKPVIRKVQTEQPAVSTEEQPEPKKRSKKTASSTTATKRTTKSGSGVKKKE
jgi:hypothetical protein